MRSLVALLWLASTLAVCLRRRSLSQRACSARTPARFVRDRAFVQGVLSTPLCCSLALSLATGHRTRGHEGCTESSLYRSGTSRNSRAFRSLRYSLLGSAFRSLRRRSLLGRGLHVVVQRGLYRELALSVRELVHRCCERSSRSTTNQRSNARLVRTLRTFVPSSRPLVSFGRSQTNNNQPKRRKDRRSATMQRDTTITVLSNNKLISLSAVSAYYCDCFALLLLLFDRLVLNIHTVACTYIQYYMCLVY